MNFNTIIGLLKQKKCKHCQKNEQSINTQIQILRKTKGQNDILKIIQDQCPPQYRQRILGLIENSPLSENQLDIIIQVYTLSKIMIEKYLINSVDLIALINFIRFNQPQKVNKIAEMYGLQKQCKKYLNELMLVVFQLSREIVNQSFWRIIENKILLLQKIHSHVLLIMELQNQTVDSKQKLIQLASKHKIFIIKQKEAQLFDTISSLGIQDQLSKTIINQSTYLAFRSDLTELCQRIIVKNQNTHPNIIKQQLIDKYQRIKIGSSLPQQKRQQKAYESLIFISSSLSNFEHQSSNNHKSIQKQQQDLYEQQIEQVNMVEQNISIMSNQKSSFDQFSSIFIDSSQNQQESSFCMQRINSQSNKLKNQTLYIDSSLYKQQQSFCNNLLIKHKEYENKMPSFINPFQLIYEKSQQQMQRVFKKSNQKSTILLLNEDNNKMNRINNGSDSKQKTLMIILSQDKVDCCEIYKQKSDKIQIEQIIQSKRYMNVFYTFIYINMKLDYQYQIKTASNQSMLKDAQLIQFYYQQSHKDCMLTVILDKKITTNQAIVLNFALLNSIGFIINHIIKKTQHIQENIFIWLKLLYNQYKFIRQSDLQNMLRQFRIQDGLSQLNTQFFIYFFYSIYKEKALQYCMQNTQMKLKYFRQYRQNDHKYPQSDEFHSAYFFLNLYHIFKNINQHQQNYATSILLTNITYQQQYRLMSILNFVANYSPSILLIIERSTIIDLFIEKQSLCVHDYFNFKIRFLLWQINTAQQRQQQSIIMEFISDLIQILIKTNHQQCRKKIFGIANLNSIFVSQKGTIFTKKHLRVGDSSLPQLYLKCKQLYVLSNHQFDFLETIVPFLKQKAQKFTKQFTKIAFTCVLAVPEIGMLDRYILNKINKIGTISNKDIIQIIAILAQNRFRNYNSNKFIKITNRLFQKKSQSIRNIRPQIILQQIDRLQECQKGQTAKEQISRFFTFFSSFLSVFDDKENQVIHMKLKECLLIYFRLRNHNFRRIFIFAIFNELRQKIRREREITNLIIESIPQQDEQRAQKQQHLINLYQN